MQPQKTHKGNEGSKRRRKVQQSKLLLVGSEQGFKDITHRLFFEQHFCILGRSTTLLEGLLGLKSQAVDVVLLGREFCDEEASLFVFDAQRCGFAGLILHVSFFPTDRTSLDKQHDQHARVEAQKKPVSHSDKRHEVHAQLSKAGARTTRGVDDPRKGLSFTDKEQAVLTQVSEGWSNPQIAIHLKCSEGSVKAIVQRLFEKLGVRKRTQIVRLAFEGAEGSPLPALEGQPAEDEKPALS